MEKNERLTTLRHSCEHVLMQAMENLYPGIIKAVGPATDEGFYFDFDPSTSSGQVKISEEDFPKIEAEMLRIKDLALPISQITLTPLSAKKLFKDNSYKLEWVKEAVDRKEKLTAYWTGEPNKKGSFVDLCKGPHLNSTAEIGTFKLLSVAGAYWRGSEKNKMLTRIYGTAFETKEELDKYLQNIETAKQYDHRKIGKELGLFVFAEEVGSGLPLFTEKGTTIIRELEKFVVEEEIKRGYHHVRTPDLARVKLYEISGHYPYYKDTMYPVMEVDEDKLVLRPMSCPHHFMLFKSQTRSYRELPLRFAELAKLYRYEKSGELTGLIRLRGFCLADSHIFCSKEQAVSEIKNVIDLIDYAVGLLGFEKGKDYIYRLSLGDRDNKKKYYDDPKSWEEGENILRNVLKELKAPYYEAKDEAAFYGPKIDIQMKNVLGKEDTAFTVQYDFCLPKRFDLKFINERGQEEQPLVIHRSSIGAVERTLAFLLEKHKGALPVWLCPTQAQIIPISEKHNEYAKTVQKTLLDAGIRTEVDLRSETMQAKIRDAQTQKIPYMVIVGDKEVSANTVSIRLRDQRNFNGLGVGEFVGTVQKLINGRSLNIWS